MTGVSVCCLTRTRLTGDADGSAATTDGSDPEGAVDTRGTHTLADVGCTLLRQCGAFAVGLGWLGIYRQGVLALWGPN